MPKLPESTTLLSSFAVLSLSPAQSQVALNRTSAKRTALLVTAFTARPPAWGLLKECARFPILLAQSFCSAFVRDDAPGDKSLLAQRPPEQTPDLRPPT